MGEKMSKHTNDLHDATARRIEPAPVEPVHRIPGRVTRAELAVILRAVTLHLANNADLDDDTTAKTGAALAAICKAYLLNERSHRHANEAPKGA